MQHLIKVLKTARSLRSARAKVATLHLPLDNYASARQAESDWRN